nr:uncharacterized protein LOC118877744 [Drosophila suzukii]
MEILPGVSSPRNPQNNLRRAPLGNHTTSTSYLAAKAVMADAPVKGHLEKPLLECWSTSSSIRRDNPVQNPAPSSCRWRGKDGEASVGREGSFILLFYMNKNIR